MPGPVNQVHKPKPLGEVLLLNSSQLWDFFPSSPRLIVNWGVLSLSREFICKRKREKKREQKIIAQEESGFEEMFCDLRRRSSSLPRSLSVCSPAKIPFCATNKQCLRKFQGGTQRAACLASAQRCSSNTSADVWGLKREGGSRNLCTGLCAVPATCTAWLWRVQGKISFLRVEDRLARGGSAIPVLTPALKIP